MEELITIVLLVCTTFNVLSLILRARIVYEEKKIVADRKKLQERKDRLHRIMKVKFFGKIMSIAIAAAYKAGKEHRDQEEVHDELESIYNTFGIKRESEDDNG